MSADKRFTVGVWASEDGCRVAAVPPGSDHSSAFDACILWELTQLWEQGIKTECSCCGHGELPAKIGVAPESAEAMIALGYEPCEPLYENCFRISNDPKGYCVYNWFVAKSDLNCKEARHDF